MFLQLISANRRNTLFNYAFHKSSLFSIFFYVFSKKLLTTSAFSCIVHYVVEMQRNFIIISCAGMAELADAQASGACGSNIVRVQVPLPALFFIRLPVQAGSGSIFSFWQSKDSQNAAFTLICTRSVGGLFFHVLIIPGQIPSQFPLIFRAQMPHTGAASSLPSLRHFRISC